jgi:hypothetical protein
MTLSAATLAIVYWCVKIVGALVVAALSIFAALWHIDRKRQKCVPARHEFMLPVKGTLDGSELTLSKAVLSADRPAPLFSGGKTEKVARLSDVEHLLEPGDLGVFSGRAIFSFVVRFLGYTSISHAWLVDRKADGKLYVIDSCEGKGVTHRLLSDEVAKYPGQYYVSRIAWPYRRHYKRLAAMGWARSMLGNKYGYLSIVFQAVIHTPFIRVLAYMLNAARWVANALPYCSGFDLIACREGRLDLVPGRDPALTNPQDIFQSLAAEEWIALVP